MSDTKSAGKGGRKRVRCEECRKSHKKCDQQKPKCGNCVFRGWPCVYPEVERNRNRAEDSFQDRQRVYQFTEWRPPPQMIPQQQQQHNFFHGNEMEAPINHHIPQIHHHHQTHQTHPNHQTHQTHPLHHHSAQPQVQMQATASEPRLFPLSEPVPLGPSSITEPASIHFPSEPTQLPQPPKPSQNKMEISFLLH